MLMTIFITSCFHANLWTAMNISKNFPKEYTGLDTLIRIDGYYYMENKIRFQYEDSATLKIVPIFFLKNSEFKNYHAYFDTHASLHNDIAIKSCNGNYIIHNDTIKAKWVMPYGVWHYYIFTEKYLIVNDTTLLHIWRSIESPAEGEEKREIEKNEIYHFYEYPFDVK
jgi:hypothetical protein